MRIAFWKALTCVLLTTATLHAAADKLQTAVASLASNDPSTARQAEKYLTGHKSESEPLLRRMMLDGSQSGIAHFRAARLLGDFGDRAAVADLKRVLLSGIEPEATVRAEIIRSLVRLGGSSILIDYFQQGKENAPLVNAAIAMGLQGNTNDEAKKTLGALMSNPDARVAEAAMSAACWTYQSISKQDPNCPTSLGDAALAAPGGPTQVEHDFALITKANPTPGDLAILNALKVRQQTSNDPQVSQHAAALLNTLSDHYKQE